MALEKADGDFIALIDDDESPDEDWLCNLYKSIESYNVDGVLGPVKPCFEDDPPDWVTNGKFFDRPTHETGYRIGLSDARTGNVLFRRRILNGVVSPFLEKFGTGGEDVDFFQRMMEKGFVFVWCNEAVVYESVPLSRCTRGSLLRRALLRGRNSLKLNTSYSRKLIKSIIALPVYSLALPFLFIAGDHHFMKYMIKFCDHAGRLLALLKLNPVKERTL
jgi:succinoglycan biosynthesis protein ExoM